MSRTDWNQQQSERKTNQKKQGHLHPGDSVRRSRVCPTCADLCALEQVDWPAPMPAIGRIANFSALRKNRPKEHQVYDSYWGTFFFVQQRITVSRHDSQTVRQNETPLKLSIFSANNNVGNLSTKQNVKASSDI